MCSQPCRYHLRPETRPLQSLQLEFRFTDIPVPIIVRSLFQGGGNAAVSIVLGRRKLGQGIYRQILALGLDGDAAHDFIVGQTGIFGTCTVVSCHPDNRVVVFVFVNSFNTNFVSIKEHRFLMESRVIIFQI